jgi:transposase
MSGKAAKVAFTELQQEILQQFARATTTPARLVQRASIILLAFAGWLNQRIASEVDLDRKQVGQWRRRWKESFAALVSIECHETKAELRRAVEDVLSDAPRSGSPGTFKAEQVTAILAVACESPEQSGRPINCWTARELADEVVKRKIVDSISPSQVGRLLAQAELQPHRCKYWLNTKEKDLELFQQQVEVVCQTYLNAPDLYFQMNTHTVCVDEMPGLQALERIANTIPMQPGQPQRIEYEYERHGTLCLTGNWHVVTGQMIAPTISETRTEEEFAQHIRQTVQTDPQAGWIFVVDNLNTHCSETLVRYIGQVEAIDESTLGQKGKSGVLKSMATRQAFLADSSHRIRIVYLPKHSSWLNQVEIVFGIVGRRLMRRASFPSLVELKDRLLRFIEYFNTTFAKPFRWTYTGRPTAKEAPDRPRTWKESWARNRLATAAFALVG